MNNTRITPEIVAKPDIVTKSQQYIHEISGKEVFQEDWHEYYSEADSPRELKSRLQQMLQTIQQEYQFDAESKTTSYQSVSELKTCPWRIQLSKNYRKIA